MPTHATEAFAQSMSTSGIGPPVAAAPDGAVYREKNAAGRVVALWERTGGAWGRFLSPAPLVSLQRVAPQSCPYNTQTYLSWDTEDDDALNMSDQVALPGAITPSEPGLWDVFVTVAFSAHASLGRRSFSIVRTYGFLPGGFNVPATPPSPTGTAQPTVISAAWPVRIAAGDWLGFPAFHLAGSGITLTVTGALTAIWRQA